MLTRILTFITVVATIVMAAAGAQAQDATPAAESLFASLGLPELTVTAKDTGFTLSQSEIAAGRYLVTVVNETSAPEAYAGFVRLMPGKTLADLSIADELASGTPMPEEGPDPASLAWFYETYIPGGTIAFTDAPGRSWST